MEKEILDVFISQGVWAVLSVILIFYILKNQEKRDLKQEEREEKYQGIISSLTEKLNVIDDVKSELSEIKQIIIKNKS